jgi:hypothetical protein
LNDLSPATAFIVHNYNAPALTAPNVVNYCHGNSAGLTDAAAALHLGIDQEGWQQKLLAEVLGMTKCVVSRSIGL